MNNSLLGILALCLIASSCKKEEKDKLIVRNYPKTYAEALDSLHIRYEKKYLYRGNVRYFDTIIFHADGGITEINPLPPATSITFKPQNSGDYYFVFQSYPYKDIAVKFYPINDTPTEKFPLHNQLVYDTVVFELQSYSTIKSYWDFYGKTSKGYYSMVFSDDYEQ